MARSHLSDQLLFFSLVIAAEAYKTFETKCSTPITSVNYVSPPDSRGTLDILWSSVFTIVACTWTIQHLNVPEQRNGRDPGWKGDLHWRLKGFYESTKWMLYTMIAPEIITATACHDFMAARNSNRKLRDFSSLDNVPWTLTHSYYANMGGFVIRSRVSEDAAATVPYIKMDDMRIESSLGTDDTHGDNPSVPQKNEKAKRIQLNSKLASTEATQRLPDLPYNDLYHLTAYQIHKLRNENIIPKLPLITEEEINDKSKSDSLIKAIAVVQILWTTLQIIVRAARNLAISQLELSVLAFAVCAMVAYGLYWAKPKSVGSTTTILQYQGRIPPAVLENFEKDEYENILLFFLGSILPDSKVVSGGGSSIINGLMGSPEYDAGRTGVALILGAVLFGGIHIGAWNFHFPSKTELIFWRCASIYSAAFGPGLIFLGMILDFLTDKIKETIGMIAVTTCGCLYIIARLFLLVEIFRTLCFLPPDAFVSTWTSNLPHII